jgi:hypothetical protein
MKPVEICQRVLGSEKLEEVLSKLSSPQIKSVLKEGGVKVKLPAGIVSQQRRRQIWSTRVKEAIAGDNQEAAGQLLQQWLLHHERALLISYLDTLGVKHSAGETDDSFLLSIQAERAREAAQQLLASRDPVVVRAYLHYIAYQQRSTVFEGWEALEAQQTGA